MNRIWCASNCIVAQCFLLVFEEPSKNPHDESRLIMNLGWMDMQSKGPNMQQLMHHCSILQLSFSHCNTVLRMINSDFYLQGLLSVAYIKSKGREKGLGVWN